jgi:hypothetical protein
MDDPLDDPFAPEVAPPPPASGWSSLRHAWADLAILGLGAILLIPDAGWTGLLLTPLGLGREQIAKLLAQPLACLTLLIFAAPWLVRAGHWARTQEDAFWRRDALRKAGFLLIHWPLPLGLILALAVGRELWDRLPTKEDAARSHARWLRLSYLILLAIAARLAFETASAPLPAAAAP